MTNFIINIYDNQNCTYAKEQIPFQGDLRTAKEFALAIALNTKLYDCSIYIFEANDYHDGEDCLAVLDLDIIERK